MSASFLTSSEVPHDGYNWVFPVYTALIIVMTMSHKCGVISQCRADIQKKDRRSGVNLLEYWVKLLQGEPIVNIF